MKKNYITIAIVVVLIIGVIAGIIIYINKNNNIVKKQNVIENKSDEISEKIIDDCTEEWNELEENQKTEILETGSHEEKISPNSLITMKKYYKKCGHITNEYIDIPNELINKTKKELQEKYSDWKIEKFSSTQITLYKEFDGECDEHYVLREEEGKIIINKINENNEEQLYEKTEISIDYLTDTDKQSIEKGIKIYGNENLNQLIEDFE